MHCKGASSFFSRINDVIIRKWSRSVIQAQTDCFSRSVKAAHWRYLLNKSLWLILWRVSVETELQYWVNVFKSILANSFGFILLAGEGVKFMILGLLEVYCCLFDFLRFVLLETLVFAMSSSEPSVCIMSMTSAGGGGSFGGDFGLGAVLSFSGARFDWAGDSDSSLDDSSSVPLVCSDEDLDLPPVVSNEEFCVQFWSTFWRSAPDRWELLQLFFDF